MMHTNLRNFNTSENRIFSSGLTLIEVALAIIISAIITIGIIQAIGSATKRMHESAEANYINILARAMNDYVKVNAATITMAADSDKPAVAFLNGFVPEHMNATSPNNLTYNTSFILPPAHTTQTSQNVQAFLVANTNAKNWTAEELASIALLSAPSAGYRSDIMNANNIISPGGWAVPKSSFPANGIPANNSLVIYANMLTGGISGGNWIARNPNGPVINNVTTAGPKNTMNTDILMNGNDVQHSIFNAKSFAMTAGGARDIASALYQSPTTGHQTAAFCYLQNHAGTALTVAETNCETGNPYLQTGLFLAKDKTNIEMFPSSSNSNTDSAITLGAGLGGGSNNHGILMKVTSGVSSEIIKESISDGIVLESVGTNALNNNIFSLSGDNGDTSLMAGTILLQSAKNNHSGLNVDQASLSIQSMAGNVGIFANSVILEEGGEGINLMSDDGTNGPIEVAGSFLQVDRGIKMVPDNNTFAGITGVNYITSSMQRPYAAPDITHNTNSPYMVFDSGSGTTRGSVDLYTSSLNIDSGNIVFIDPRGRNFFHEIDNVSAITFGATGCRGSNITANICGSADALYLYGSNGNKLTITPQRFTFFGANVNIKHDLAVDGNLTYGTLNSNSDRRLKKDIVPLHDMLQVLNKIHGYSFRWKKNNKKDVGVIAQEVQKVFPGFVGSTKINKKSYLTVSYTSFIAPIISAIQELYHKFLTFVGQVDARFHTEDLKIKTLQSKVNKLQKSNENLKIKINNVQKQFLQFKKEFYLYKKHNK